MSKTDLRELESKATPGPWFCPHSNVLASHPQQDGDGAWTLVLGIIHEITNETDAALIIALRNAAPFLLDVVDAARLVDRLPGDPDWEDKLSARLAALDAHLASKP